MGDTTIRQHSITVEQVLAPGNLPYQMFLLVQQLTKRLQAVLDPHQLTPLHWGILSCLWVEDGLRTSDIAEKLEQLGGTITVGLDATEARRLIRRKQDGADRRVFRIYLTKRGKDLQSTVEPAVKSLLADLFRIFTADEYAKLSGQITALREHVSHDPKTM